MLIKSLKLLIIKSFVMILFLSEGFSQGTSPITINYDCNNEDIRSTKISDEDKKAVEDAIGALKAVIGGEDAAIIDARAEDLSKAWYKVAEQL